MNILYQMVVNALISTYFYLIGEAVITKHVGDRLEIKTQINSVIYNCVCQELVYLTVARRIFGGTKTSRLYSITMYPDGDGAITKGTYPLLCSPIFLTTSYPYVLAIRCHHSLFYS